MVHEEENVVRGSTSHNATSPVEGSVGEASVTSLSEQLAAAQAEAAEYLDSWRRSVAELSNARKRMQREQDELRSMAGARIIEKLLPIVDDFDRAFATLAEERLGDDWVAGFRLIHQKLQTLLEGERVAPIPTEGQVFDPELHHAVSFEEAEGFSEGEIIDQVVKGYRLGDRVLRPSMVRVARASHKEN